MNSHRHFYLYAKGHYKKTDTLMDLKVIQGKWAGVDPECLMKRDVAHLLLGIARPHIIRSEMSFRDFIKYLDPAYLWAFSAFVKEVGEKYDYQMALIHCCLSFLQGTTIDEIDGDLGNPDPQILEISKTRRQWEKEQEEKMANFTKKLFKKIGHTPKEEEYFLMEQGASGKMTNLFIKAMSDQGKLDAEMGQKLHSFLESKGIAHEFFDNRKVIVDEQALNEAVLGKENQQKSEK